MKKLTILFLVLVMVILTFTPAYAGGKKCVKNDPRPQCKTANIHAQMKPGKVADTGFTFKQSDQTRNVRRNDPPLPEIEGDWVRVPFRWGIDIFERWDGHRLVDGICYQVPITHAVVVYRHKNYVAKRREETWFDGFYVHWKPFRYDRRSGYLQFSVVPITEEVYFDTLQGQFKVWAVYGLRSTWWEIPRFRCC